MPSYSALKRKETSAAQNRSASVTKVMMIYSYSCCQFFGKYNFQSKKAYACLFNDPFEYVPVSLRSVIIG